LSIFTFFTFLYECILPNSINTTYEQTDKNTVPVDLMMKMFILIYDSGRCTYEKKDKE